MRTSRPPSTFTASHVVRTLQGRRDEPSACALDRHACLTPCLRLPRAAPGEVLVGLVIDRLTAEERDLVSSFTTRAPQLTPQSRAVVAASIAKRLRPRVDGASAFAIDLEFVNAVATAIRSGISMPSTIDRNAHAERGVVDGQDVIGRRYVLSRLDDLVGGGALDRPSAERVRAVIESELVSIESARSAPSSAQSVPEPGLKQTPSAVGPSGPTALDLVAGATRTFATEETPSLLLYIGAFLVVVAAFIFVSECLGRPDLRSGQARPHDRRDDRVPRRRDRLPPLSTRP